MRYYLAVRGGFEVEPVLGSRSFDTLAGFGPRLQAGDHIAIGPDPGTPITTDLGFRQPLSTLIHLSEGPRSRLVHGRGVDTLTTQPYVVSPSGNRVGARLTGPVLERVAVRELFSEGLVEGRSRCRPTVSRS